MLTRRTTLFCALSATVSKVRSSTSPARSTDRTSPTFAPSYANTARKRVLYSRHRRIVSAMHNDAINVLTRYSVVIFPKFDAHSMAHDLSSPFARELLSYRHGEFVEKLAKRCEITGTLLIRGLEWFVFTCVRVCANMFVFVSIPLTPSARVCDSL